MTRRRITYLKTHFEDVFPKTCLWPEDVFMFEDKFRRRISEDAFLPEDAFVSEDVF